MDGQEAKITESEIITALESMAKQTEGIRKACGLMVDAGIADLTDGIELADDIAVTLAGELAELKEQLLKRGTA